MVDIALVVPQTHLPEDLVRVQIENSGVGILPAIESTFKDCKLEAYATLETQKPNLDDALAEGLHEAGRL